MQILGAHFPQDLSGVGPIGHCEFSPSSCNDDTECDIGGCILDYRDGNVPRLSLTAGNFRNGSAAAPGQLPVWSLAAGYKGSRVGGGVTGQVQFFTVQGNQLEATFNYPQDYRSVTPDLEDTSFIITAYDRNGNSVYVGPPVLIAINQLLKPDIIIQEPPKHIDWLNGGFVNVNRKTGLQVQMTDDSQATYSSKTTSASDWTIGASIAVDVKASITAGVPKIDAVKESTEVKVKVEGSFDEKASDYDSRSTTYDFSVTSATTEDDLVGGSFRTLFIWRYPIIGFTPKDANGQPLIDPVTKKPLNGFYEIMLSGEVGQFLPSGALNFDWYQPFHENGIVLS